MNLLYIDLMMHNGMQRQLDIVTWHYDRYHQDHQMQKGSVIFQTKMATIHVKNKGFVLSYCWVITTAD